MTRTPEHNLMAGFDMQPFQSVAEERWEKDAADRGIAASWTSIIVKLYLIFSYIS